MLMGPYLFIYFKFEIMQFLVKEEQIPWNYHRFFMHSVKAKEAHSSINFFCI